MTRHLFPCAALAALLLALPAAAQDAAPDAAPKPTDNPMAGWTPSKVKDAAKDKKEIHAFFMKMEEAGKKGDLAAAAALVDFPVTMITDDKKGEGSGTTWSREQWEAVMKPFYAKPMPDMKVSHKPTIHLLSDALAVAVDEWSMTTGKQKMAGKSAMVLIRKAGEWKAKSMIEGGWGDMPMPEGAKSAAK